MSGGGKGGSTTSKVEVPQWVEDAAQENIGTARDIARLDYVPYYGPDVAAATPQQMASWQGANQAASAFGMPTGEISLPEAQNFGGVQAYSSGGIYDQALAELRRRRPEQFAARQNIFGPQQQAQPFASQAMTRDAEEERYRKRYMREYGGGNR